MLRSGFWLLLLTSVSLSAQPSAPDTVRKLAGIEILSTRLTLLTAGTKVEKVDSALLSLRSHVSLAALLSEQSAAFVRSYGTGGLATLSFRGTLTTQAGVFWNGFNINQPNMGMTDLSLIPALFFNSLELQYGGASALFGSGLIGGSLHLANSAAFETPLSARISASAGCYGNYNLSSRISAGNRRLAWTGALSGLHNANSFAYTDLSGNRKNQEHAQASGTGILQQVDVRLSEHQSLSAAVWWQQSNRDIPATLVMASNDQEQVDRSFRSTLQWTWLNAVSRWQVRSAWFSEYLHFTSPIAEIDAIYRLKTRAVEATFRRQLGRAFSLDAGVSGRLLLADVPYYESNESRKEGAAYISGLFSPARNKWRYVLTIRQDLAEGYKVPFCFSAGAEGPFAENLSARFSFSRNYRVPTLNDRFWQPGGNPDLKPESSWNQEAGLIWSHNCSEKLRTSLGATLYNILITDLIQWVNVTTTIWSPMNIQQVWSRGLELESMLRTENQHADAAIRLKYVYSPSTYSGGKSEERYQLIYIPLHRLILNATGKYKTIYGSFTGTFTGKRYVVKDNSRSLPGYALLNFTIGRSFLLKKTSLNIQADVSNLMNSEFQVVQYYPEPGISASLKLTLNLR